MDEWEPEQPPPLFIVDSVAQDIVPSLPFCLKGLGKKHALKFFVQGLSSHHESFTSALHNEKNILPHYSTVGKLFVLIEGQNTEITGSAFFVSPTVLCTAGHIQSHKMIFTPARNASSVEAIEGQGEAIFVVSELGKDWIYERKAEERLAVHLTLV